MSEVMALINKAQEKSGLTPEMFAHQIGLTTAAYWRHRSGRRGFGTDSLKLYARYAKQTGNNEMLKGIIAYITETEPEDFVFQFVSKS